MSSDQNALDGLVLLLYLDNKTIFIVTLAFFSFISVRFPSLFTAICECIEVFTKKLSFFSYRKARPAMFSCAHLPC